MPRTMVSLAFKGHDCMTQSTLFQHCVSACKKVERILIDSVDVDMTYANVLHSTLIQSKGGVDKFLSRVKHLSLSKINFLVGESEGHQDFAIGKFCQVLMQFTGLQSLEIEHISHLPKIVSFFNNLSNGDNPRKIPFYDTVTSLKI